MRDIPNEDVEWAGDCSTVTDSLQSVFEALAARRRRLALSVLVEREPPIDVGTLSQAVAEREGSTPDDRAVHHVQMSLHHAHLPKLADAGLVEYDWERGIVEESVDGHGSLLNSVEAATSVETDDP